MAQSQTAKTPETLVEDNELGRRIHRLRQERGWKLADLSKKSGIATSSLSKVENGVLSLTYDRLIMVAYGFGLTLSEFLTDDHKAGGSPKPAVPMGRVSVHRDGAAKLVSTENYDYQYMCTDVRNKAITPILVEVKSTSIEEFGPLITHEGEEFIFVLKGQIEVHTELYEPKLLNEGEGVYLDSAMGHAFVKKSRGKAVIVSAVTSVQALSR
ncbi:MAG: XRE family transcriptional regulator [Henriciella sp.]|nr:XRE family transcriptional regulator [Henriciella sp.]